MVRDESETSQRHGSQESPGNKINVPVATNMKRWHVVVLDWSSQTDVFQQCLKIDPGHTHATAAILSILSNWSHLWSHLWSHAECTPQEPRRTAQRTTAPMGHHCLVVCCPTLQRRRVRKYRHVPIHGTTPTHAPHDFCWCWCWCWCWCGCCPRPCCRLLVVALVALVAEAHTWLGSRFVPPLSPPPRRQ